MYICFTEAVKRYGSPFNSFAAWITGGKFCHVAVVFEIKKANGTYEYIECSVEKTTHKEEDVVVLREPGKFEGWTCYKAETSQMQEMCALEYVKNNLLNKPYDRNGAVIDFGLFWCLPNVRAYRDPDCEKVYCSRLVMIILHQAQIFQDVELESISPNDIYKQILLHMRKSGNIWSNVTVAAPKLFSGELSKIAAAYDNDSTGEGDLYY